MYNNALNTIKVGPAENGKQQVSMYDKQDKVYRTVISTPDKVDEFISDKKANSKKTKKIAGIVALAGTAIGAVAGLLFGNKIIDIDKLGGALAGAAAGLGLAGLADGVLASINAKKNKKVNQEFLNNNK